MRALSKLLSLLVLLGVLAIAAVAWLVLDRVPLVDRGPALSHHELARAEALLKGSGQQQLSASDGHTVEIAARDLDLAVDYLVRRWISGNAQLTLSADRIDFSVSIPVPHDPWQHVLNITGAIDAGGSPPRVDRLRIGRVTLPPAMADRLAAYGLRALLARTGIEPATAALRGLQVTTGYLRLVYGDDSGADGEVRNALLTGSDHAALRLYHDLLVELQDQGFGRDTPLVEWLVPLFALAQARSSDRDPVAENVALLTVLGTWASRRDLAQLVPDAARRPQRFRSKLQGRRDFAQHFLTSAALAARSDSTLSDAIGLFKELADTDRGSGFSFTDIAADRAGTRFGALAAGSTEDARRVQRRIASGVVDGDLMPPAKDLPEHMRSEDFAARFEHVGSPAYQQMMAEIERRIDACSLYQD